jgi:hypothetical protein
MSGVPKSRSADVTLLITMEENKARIGSMIVCVD